MTCCFVAYNPLYCRLPTSVIPNVDAPEYMPPSVGSVCGLMLCSRTYTETKKNKKNQKKPKKNKKKKFTLLFNGFDHHHHNKHHINTQTQTQHTSPHQLPPHRMQQTPHGLAIQVNDDFGTDSMSRENENMLREKLPCRCIASHRCARPATGRDRN